MQVFRREQNFAHFSVSPPEYHLPSLFLIILISKSHKNAGLISAPVSKTSKSALSTTTTIQSMIVGF